jgi:hypothetical protein
MIDRLITAFAGYGIAVLMKSEKGTMSKLRKRREVW